MAAPKSDQAIAIEAMTEMLTVKLDEIIALLTAQMVAIAEAQVEAADKTRKAADMTERIAKATERTAEEGSRKRP